MKTDLSERDKLIIKNMPLVLGIAKRMASKRIEKRKGDIIQIDDLRQWGFIGLIDATEKFDAEKGYQFSTYATWRIRGAIQDGLRGLDPSTRADRKLLRKIEELHGQGLSYDEIKRNLKINDSMYAAIWSSKEFSNPFSLDDEVLEGTQLHETVAQKEIDHIDRLTRDQEYLLLHKASRKLEERDRIVFQMLYYEERTMKDVGKALGVTESRVCQLVTRLEEKLKIILHPFIEKPASNGKYQIRFSIEEISYLMNAREELIHEVFGEKSSQGSLLEELAQLKERRYQLKREKPNTVY